MKKSNIVILCFVLGAFYFYNTNWFQSFFLYDRFYQNICDTPFDVTTKGETISIPLRYKHKTCYYLAITVPDKSVTNTPLVGPGLLGYRFTSGGRTIKEGLSHPPDRHQMGLKKGISRIYTMVFNLPLPQEGKDLTLEVEVVEPFNYLKPYAGKTRCQIAPNYSAKLGRCINEKMLIDR